MLTETSGETSMGVLRRGDVEGHGEAGSGIRCRGALFQARSSRRQNSTFRREAESAAECAVEVSTAHMCGHVEFAHGCVWNLDTGVFSGCQTTSTPHNARPDHTRPDQTTQHTTIDQHAHKKTHNTPLMLIRRRLCFFKKKKLNMCPIVCTELLHCQRIPGKLFQIIAGWPLCTAGASTNIAAQRRHVTHHFCVFGANDRRH